MQGNARERAPGRAGRFCNRLRRLAIAPALLLILPVPVRAHDFWIEPDTYHPAAGELVAIRLFVGHGAAAEELPRNPEHLGRFVLGGPGGVSDVAGRAGVRPAGVVRAPPDGPGVVGYESRGNFVRLDAAAFESYLAEEGLERIIEQRTRRRERSEVGRETFFRCAKALLDRGSGTRAGGHDRVLGLRLEILPEADPYALAAGDKLPVRLLYRGRPIADVLVEARLRGRPAYSRKRTDREGRASLELPTRGLWLLTAVHMTRAPAPGESDWQSWWASLSFDNSG